LQILVVNTGFTVCSSLRVVCKPVGLQQMQELEFGAEYSNFFIRNMFGGDAFL